MVFPLNKKIWTSSYVLYTTGLAVIVLSVLIFVIEFKGVKGAWSRFCDVFGKNPLFIFFLSGFLPRVLALIRIPNGRNVAGNTTYVSPIGWFYEHICKPISSDLRDGSLFYSVCLIIFFWLIGYVLDKKRIYIKVWTIEKGFEIIIAFFVFIAIPINETLTQMLIFAARFCSAAFCRIEFQTYKWVTQQQLNSSANAGSINKISQ